ncbi:hypothetical protein F5Y16DRAFT_370255 [Xylariaceae sp. FL0255]|nr:hypothetical protein F5Y16DRAFT_370255 [Xylariaceae sp. FL0255]
MASANEPPEDTIVTFSEMFAIPRDQAIIRLKANGNDLERAANDYLEDPSGQKYEMKWDESPWNTDREGGHHTNNEFAFNIQAPDEHPPPLSYVNSAAPTRPPSRNPSPLGRLIDLTALEAAGIPANSTQEDEDLRKAIAASAAESGIPPQEIGLIDNESGNKYFGPANRPEYQSDQWALIQTTVMSDAKGADPPPSGRKRDVDAPVFLRQNEDTCVGALLTVYTKIPLVRNILLQTGSPVRNYGQNSEWWRGKPILPKAILDRLAAGEQLWNNDARADFVEELHRLVAFLELSDRSYGNADMLVETRAVETSLHSWDTGQRFLQALSNAAEDVGIEAMSTTGQIMSVIQDPLEKLEDDSDLEDDKTSFMILDLDLGEETYGWVETIYDAIDHLMWSSALSLDFTFPEDAKTATLLKPAEVLTIRFGNGGLVKPCDVPEIFYADRYMAERSSLAMHFQTQIRTLKTALSKLNTDMKAMEMCDRRGGCAKLEDLDPDHAVHDCSKKFIDFAIKQIERCKRDALWRTYQKGGDTYSAEDLRRLHTWQSDRAILNAEENDDVQALQRIIGAHQEIMKEVDEAMKDMTEEKEEHLNVLEQIRKRLTCQESEADNKCVHFGTDTYRPEYWDPKHKYYLRGVVINKDLAYVCVHHPTETTDIKFDQWWKIGYARDERIPVIAQKVTASDATLAAGTEGKNPIMVYATEGALKEQPLALSDTLRMFVKTDNRSFQQELDLEQTAPPVDEVPVLEAPTATGGITAANLASLASLEVDRLEVGIKRKHSETSSVATVGSNGSDPPEADAEGSSPLGGIAAALANCQTADNQDRMPEMSERSKGMLPFLAQPSTAVQQPQEDVMDMDTEMD